MVTKKKSTAEVEKKERIKLGKVVRETVKDLSVDDKKKIKGGKWPLTGLLTGRC